MADSKISALTEVTDLLATDEFILARSSTTRKLKGAVVRGDFYVSQASHGFAVGDVLYYTGSAYAKAKADAAATAETLGIVAVVNDANAFTLRSIGRVTGLSGLTAGTTYFLSAATAGALTATEPTTVGHVSKPLLVADSTTTGYFFNMRGILLSGLGFDPADSSLVNAMEVFS